MIERVRSTARIAGFLGLTSASLVSLFATELVTKKKDLRALRERRAHTWAHRLLWIFNVEVVLEGELPEGPFLLVPNHRAALDILIVRAFIGGHFVSRADLARWPLIGQAAESVGTIFVDRSNKSSGSGALREVERVLKSGANVVVFPEGTTFIGDEVRPLHAASLLPAVRTGTKLVPLGIAYETGSEAAFVGETFGKHLARATRAKKTRVALVLGESIPTTGLPEDPPARRKALTTLGNDLRMTIQALVDRARVRIDQK